MVKTLQELQRELAFEKEKSKRARVQFDLKRERMKLRFELAKARNPGFFAAGKAISTGARKLGRGIVKQGSLIKLQQEREIAEDRKFARKIKASTVIKRRKPIRKTRKRKRRNIP